MKIDTDAIVDAMVQDIRNVKKPTDPSHRPTGEEALEQMPLSGPMLREATAQWKAEGRSEFYIARQSMSILMKAGRRVKKAKKSAA